MTTSLFIVQEIVFDAIGEMMELVLSEKTRMEKCCSTFLIVQEIVFDAIGEMIP